MDGSYWEGDEADDDQAEMPQPDDDDEGASWPVCPSCRRRRHTSCPVCGTAGTDFPTAFQPDEELLQGVHVALDREALLVICPSCDEPFPPLFPARCEWCGHRFADGWEPSRAQQEPSELNPRVWIVLAGLIVTVLTMIGVFAALVSEQ